MRYIRKKCRCDECPFQGHTKVHSTGPRNAKLAVCGEAPGAEEEKKGFPFVGSAGNYLAMALGRIRVGKDNVHLFNVLLCRPPRNDIGSVDAIEALRCCLPGFYAEVDYLAKRGVKVIIPTGNTACSALGIDSGITKVRGSVYTFKDVVLVPTYHPSWVMQYGRKELGTWLTDLSKGRELSVSGWKPPKEKFNVEPTLKDVEEFSRRVKKDTLLGVDIETYGSIDGDQAKVLMIGFAISGEEALVVPVMDGYEEYWDPKVWPRVKKLVEKMLTVGKCVYQQGSFDTYWLMQNGFKFSWPAHDTLLMHHAIHPELPHRLDYIVSIYGSTPYWKETLKSKKGLTRDLDQKELRTYNARDCVTMLQILDGMLKDLKRVGTESTYYDISLKLIKPVVRMKDAGIKVSKAKLKKFRELVISTIDRLDDEMRKDYKLGSTFNFNSTQHLGCLLYGKAPEDRIERIEKELLEYDTEGSRKNKNTKKYKQLKSAYDALTVKGFEVQLKNIPTTDKGGMSTNEGALLSFRNMLTSRKDYLEGLKRPTDRHRKEVKECERALKFVVKLLEYRHWAKLLSTYVEFTLGSDGKVHPDWRIDGTTSGRFSCSSPNMQNPAPEVCHVFVPEKENVFVSADYENLELVILAYLSEDIPTIEAIERGENIHDFNTRVLFGIDKDNPKWKDLRKLAKVYRFGRNYGGGMYGIYSRIVASDPDCGLSFNQFKRVDRDFLKAHPAFAKWEEETKKNILITRKATTAFGRVRILRGSDNEILREGINHYIQGSAADVVNTAMIGLDNCLEKRSELGRIIIQKHDELVVECGRDYLRETGKLMKEFMESPVKIGKYTVGLKVDLEYASSLDKDDRKPLQV